MKAHGRCFQKAGCTLPDFPSNGSNIGRKGLLYSDSKLPQKATDFLLHTRMVIST